MRVSQHRRNIRNNIYLLFQSIRSNSYTERFKLDFRQEWSMEEIFLPNEFRCPICNGKLRLFRYKGKYGPYGYPMIGCGNWGKCKSPWRRRPERFPWHVWVGFDEDGTLRPNWQPRNTFIWMRKLNAMNTWRKSYPGSMTGIQNCIKESWSSIGNIVSEG